MLTLCKRNQKEDKWLGYELRFVFSSWKILSRCTIITEKSEHLYKETQKYQFAKYFKGTLSGLRQFLATESPDEKCFLFHLKSSCRSQDIHIFVLDFWSCRNTA